jgi:hypothetical protein
MQANDNLKLKSRRLILHAIFLVISLINELMFLLVESDRKFENILLIFARFGYGVILVQLLFILLCLPNETD